MFLYKQVVVHFHDHVRECTCLSTILHPSSKGHHLLNYLLRRLVPCSAALMALFIKTCPNNPCIWHILHSQWFEGVNAVIYGPRGVFGTPKLGSSGFGILLVVVPGDRQEFRSLLHTPYRKNGVGFGVNQWVVVYLPSSIFFQGSLPGRSPCFNTHPDLLLLGLMSFGFEMF